MAGQDREAVTRIYANIGKAIAAYERRSMPGLSRFEPAVVGQHAYSPALDPLQGRRTLTLL
jgi:hypothetical protein